MNNTQTATSRRMAMLGIAGSVTFGFAASIFVHSIFGDSNMASVAYAVVATITAFAAVLTAAPLRVRTATTAGRVPKIPGANARWAYRAVSRPRGTVLMGSAPTIL